MKKHSVGNVMATSAAVLMAIVTIWASVTYLRKPEVLLDWIVLVLSGGTTAIIVFFIVWGHFQEEQAAGS